MAIEGDAGVAPATSDSGGAPPPTAPAARGRIGQSFDSPPGGAPAPTLDEAANAQGIRPQRQDREPIPGDEGVADEGAEQDGYADPTEDLLEGDEQAEELEGEDAPIFGVPPAELMAALREGKLPPQMVETLTLDVPQPDGSSRAMSLKEIAEDYPKGVMRRVDYTRKTEELAGYRKQAQAVIERETARQEWPRNPQAMFDELISMPGMLDIPGKSGALYQIAKHISDERRRWDAMSEPEQRAELATQAAERRAAEVDAREAKLRESESVRRRTELQQTFARQLEQAMPAAFAKVQVKPSKLSTKLFNEHLGAVTAEIPDGEFRGLTQAMVDEAAARTRESLGELGRLDAHTPAPAPRPGAQPQRRPQPAGLHAAPQRPQGLSPTPIGGGRPPGTAPAQRSNGAPKRARLGQTPGEFYSKRR